MSKELTVENIDRFFDDIFDDIDVSANDKSERNSYSLSQIREAYEESKEER